MPFMMLYGGTFDRELNRLSFHILLGLYELHG